MVPNVSYQLHVSQTHNSKTRVLVRSPKFSNNPTGFTPTRWSLRSCRGQLYQSLCSCQLWLANCSFIGKYKIRRTQENLTEINTVDYATVQNPDSNQHWDEITGIKCLQMLCCSSVFKRHSTSCRLVAPLLAPLLTARQRHCLLFCILNLRQ